MVYYPTDKDTGFSSMFKNSIDTNGYNGSVGTVTFIFPEIQKEINKKILKIKKLKNRRFTNKALSVIMKEWGFNSKGIFKKVFYYKHIRVEFVLIKIKKDIYRITDIKIK